MDYSVGHAVSSVHTVTAADVESFARVSGDSNPVHLDEAFAATTRFKRRIAHGMLAASYISALLGAKYPGPGTIYLSQSLAFKAPVYLGDTITTTVTVAAYRDDKGILTLETQCTNQDGTRVVEGQAVVMVTDVVAAA